MNEIKTAQEIVKNDVFSCLTTMVNDMIIEDFLYIGDFSKYDEETEEYADPLEFWDVSESLMRRLRAKGETVAEELGLNIWFRMTRGQAIYMDYVIQEIAQDI